LACIDLFFKKFSSFNLIKKFSSLSVPIFSYISQWNCLDLVLMSDFQQENEISMHGSRDALIGTWFREEDEEEGMFEDHAYLWRHLVEVAGEQCYSQKTVLDYGCNRGGFLHTLFRSRSFGKGIGVDVAERSLATARERYSDLPIDFIFPHQMHRYADSVDIAFSHEVLYLIPDLDEHAQAMARILKRHGVYYAAIGCHTGNPLWPLWRGLIAQSTNMAVFDYSLDDYARALWKVGFQVEMRPFQMNDFVLIKPNNSYFPHAADSLNYHAGVKTIIRAIAGGK
jgi:SAM-dependent methyltransferase